MPQAKAIGEGSGHSLLVPKARASAKAVGKGKGKVTEQEENDVPSGQDENEQEALQNSDIVSGPNCMLQSCTLVCLQSVHGIRWFAYMVCLIVKREQNAKTD